MRRLRAIILLIILLLILVLVFIYSGVYSVAADYPDGPVAHWILDTTGDRSIKRHAASIKTPKLDDQAMIENGFKLYREGCVECHGAPGVRAEPIAKGFNPDPPELTEEAGEWKPNELFWITKHGIRMSAMPAWGVAHSDKEIWDIVAFVQGLPSMSADEYKSMNEKFPPIEPQENQGLVEG